MVFVKVVQITGYSMANSSQTIRKSLIHTIALMVTIAIFVPDVEGAGCRRRLSRQVINYKDCLPKRLLAYSCVGTCITHAQISPINPFEIEHTCYQCKEAVVSTRKVKLQCPDEKGPKPFKRVTIEVSQPRECMCELCSYDELVVKVSSEKSNDK